MLTKESLIEGECYFYSSGSISWIYYHKQSGICLNGKYLQSSIAIDFSYLNPKTKEFELRYPSEDEEAYLNYCIKGNRYYTIEEYEKYSIKKYINNYYFY